MAVFCGRIFVTSEVEFQTLAAEILPGRLSLARQAIKIMRCGASDATARAKVAIEEGGEGGSFLRIGNLVAR